MKPKFVIGTFYTEETEYENVFDKYFLPSVMSLKFNYDVDWKVKPIRNEGTWIKNVAQKPAIILEMLETMREVGDNRTLVFVDADTKFDKYPELFDKLSETNQWDIACHYLDWQTWYKHNKPNLELLSGTMFFQNNEIVKSLLTEWHSNAIITTQWEQKVLQQLIEVRKDISVYMLPIEYCYITSLPGGKVPHVKCDPVISHYQVSRQLKRRV